MYVKLALNMNSGKTMAEIGARSKQLYKPIRRDIADLKMKFLFLFLAQVQKGFLGRLSNILLKWYIWNIPDLATQNRDRHKLLQGSLIQ